MKKILLFLALLAFLAAPAFASVGVRVGGTSIGTATDLYFPAGTTYTFDGSTFGTSTLTGAVAAITSGTIGGAAIDTSVIGGVTPAAGSFTTLSSSGVATLASAGVTAGLTVGTTLGVTGNVAVNTNKFTVTAASGNTLVAGTLAVTGTTTSTGELISATQSRIGGVSVVTGTVVTNSGATLTLTAANMAKNSIFQETGTTAATFTLDTGTALSSAVPGVQVGDMVSFVVSNASTQTVTISGATGTTVTYAMTVPTLTTRTCYAINTGSNTWSIY
jgi:hypothetical protein